MCRPARWYALSARHFSPLAASASTIPWLRAAVRSWVGAWQSGRGPEQSAERICEDLHLHAVAFVLPRVVRRVDGDLVDRQQGAVQDHERLLPGRLHRLVQGRREDTQGFDRLASVPVNGRDTDPEPRGGLGIGVTAPQMGEGKQGLAAGGQSPPPGTELPPPRGEPSRQVPQSAAGQIDRGRVDEHAKLLADTGDLGREPVYQELRRRVQPLTPNRPPSRSGWKRLSEEVDPAAVPNPAQVLRLLDAVARQRGGALILKHSSVACTSRPCGQLRLSTFGSSNATCQRRDGAC